MPRVRLCPIIQQSRYEQKLPHCSCHRRITASSLIAFHRSGARGGETRGALADRLVFQRGTGAMRFVVSRLDRRGQSSWSVFLRGWCLYSMVVMHTYLLRHMAGENRGQCLDKCIGVGRTRVGGHETRPKPKPNVD